MIGLKVYYYTPEDLGVESFHPGHMRLGGFERTENPHNADVWALGPIIFHFSKDTLLNLKYLPGREERHVVWNLADDFRAFGVPWIAIRCDCTKHVLRADPTTIPWPWPVEPLADHPILRWPHYSAEGLKYDVSFWGWVTPLDLTQRACNSVEGTELHSLIHRNRGFFGHMSPETNSDYEDLRQGFIISLWQSRLALCPASIDGVIRYRLLEQVSIGRGLPVHICDNAVMPWRDRIDWDYIVPKLNVDWAAIKGKEFDHTGLSCPEAAVDQVGDLLVEWLAEHGDEEILYRAWYAREMFNRWLHRDRWDELFGIAVRERLEGKL